MWMALLPALVGCSEPQMCSDVDGLAQGSEVQILGDSVFDFNDDTCGDVGDFLSLLLGARVVDHARGGSWLDHPSDSDIRQSYQPGGWAWVVVDGGANDLLEGCNCDCDPEVDGLIAEDTETGAMVELVERARADDARVLLFGYYEPGDESEFAGCLDEAALLSERYAALADRLEGVHFVDGREVISPTGTPESFHADQIHPTPAGAELIAEALFDVMRAAEEEIGP
jgi:hypothetical protein